jgi:Phage P22-like portal protein
MDELKKPKPIDFEVMRGRFEEAKDMLVIHHERAQDDFGHLTGERHWPIESRREREAEGKPCITINLLPQSVRTVTGQIRSMNPAVRVMTADGAASKETAEIMEGMIRHIEYQSDATSIYEAAGESAAACSLGYWRIRTDYCDEMSFDQEITLERIYNPFSVFLDPHAKHPTRMDATYGFVVDEISKEEFTRLYPDAVQDDFSTEHRPTNYRSWIAAPDGVVIAEYFWIEYKEITIGQLPDGRVVENPVAPLITLRTRKAQKPCVYWAKVTATETLEGPQEFPSRYIPIIAVTGEEWHIGEERYISSVIRFAKEPQQLYNFARSSQAEVIQLQPKAPYIGAADQFIGYEDLWAEAGNSNRPYLPYKHVEGLPPPMRQQPPVASSALMQEMQIAAEDIKRTTGIYDAGLGARSNETSGVAIAQRKEESQNSTSIYADNMVKAVTHTGRILVDMIPRVYDTARVVRVLGQDDQEKMVVINDIMMSADGPMHVNNLGIGKYDVRISVGPSYSSKKQESSEGMMEFMRVLPQAGPVIGDLIAGAQDWPDADRIAERMRKAMPPELRDDDENQEQPKPPTPQEQQAMQAQQQQQQMQMAMQDAETRKAVAMAAKAEADAAKAGFEADEARISLSIAQLQPLTLQQPQLQPQPPQGNPYAR